MSPVWLVVIGLWCSLVLLSTGCDSRNSRAAPASADVYLAEPISVATGPAPSLRVFNQVGGGITIFTGLNGEVAADVIATGFGAALESALEEADSHFNLTNTGSEIRVEAAGANQQDSAQLHVRVPPDSSLANITIPRGDVGVYGRMLSVTASITQSGSIHVFGASGDINLSTGQGSITAELAPGTNNVTVLSHGGGITVVALSAFLNASTTNGDIRFLGTLRSDRRHSIAISGTGNIDLALPPYQPVRPGQPVPKLAQPYWISATTSGSPIMADYPPTVTFEGELTALTICGFIHSPGPYDYHIENTPVRHFGRIEVSPALTGTFYFSGTLGADYYRFDTDRPNILIYAPVPQSIHIYTAEQLNQFMVGKAEIDRDCEGALNPPGSTAIVLNLTTGSGRIYLRHIFTKED